MTNWHAKIESLITEAQQYRAPHEMVWHRNVRRYGGDHWDKKAPDGHSQFTHNITQTAIIATAAVQLEQTPRVRFEPRETSEPSVAFIKPESAQKAEQFGLSPGQLEGIEPIPPQVYEYMLAYEDFQVIETGNPDMPQAAERVPVFSEDDFYVVNDQVAAEAYQEVHDAMWQRVDADHEWVENVINKSIVGHCGMLIEWNDEKHIYELKNRHELDIWIEGEEATGVHNAEYVILSQMMSVDGAVSKWPEHAEAIRSYSNRSRDHRYRNKHIQQRDMVQLYTLWKRNEQLPMSDEEALASGEVEEALDELGQPVVIDGSPVYRAGDRLTTRGDDIWPTRTGIRQVVLVADQEIYNGECPFDDIPIAWNVNIPLPHSPYGQGTPEKLEDLQQAVNRVLSILHDWIKNNPHPSVVVPESVAKQWGQLGSLFTHPGQTRSVSDADYMAFNGKVVDQYVPSPISQAAVSFFRDLIEEHNRASGHSDVLQGIASGGVESGRAIEALQQAARGQLGLISRFTERAIKQMVRITMGLVRDYLPESEWAKYITKYPPHVLRYVIQRANSLHYDISVEIVSGKGAIRRVEEEKALLLRQGGDLSRETVLDMTGIPDAKGEAKRVMQEQAAMQPVAQE